MVLPIGMEKAEGWLLDSVDVTSLTAALQAGMSVELAQFCGTPSQGKGHKGHSRSNSSVTDAFLLQGGLDASSLSALNAIATGRAPRESKLSKMTAASDVRGGTLGADGDGDRPDEPRLNMPALETGLEEREIRDLAYIMFASLCRGPSQPPPAAVVTGSTQQSGAPQPGGLISPRGGPEAGAYQQRQELLHTVRSQLEINEARAEDAERMLRVLTGPAAAAKTSPAAYAYGANGRTDPDDFQHGSLQLLTRMLTTGRPKDFSKFKHFVGWRDTLCHIALQSLIRCVRDAWRPPEPQPGSKPFSAQILLARFKSALRRMEVSSADDFDEADYSEAAAAMATCAKAIAYCCSSGWQLPWGLRIRVAEMLLRGVFDTLDEAAYIEGKEALLTELEDAVWPVLGISPAAHVACLAWVHFRQAVITGEQGLMLGTKQHIGQLAVISQREVMRRSQSMGPRSPTPAVPAVPRQDMVLATEVSGCIIDWSCQRLNDYHKHYPDGDQLQVMVEVLVFAAQSRDTSVADITHMLVGTICSSVDAEFARRLEEQEETSTDEERLMGVVAIAMQQLREEINAYCPAFKSALPHAPAIACLRLHTLFGHSFLPWLSKVEFLDDESLPVIRAAVDLEPELTRHIEPARRSAERDSAVASVLAEYRPWDCMAQLQATLAQWVTAQIDKFTLWVKRQLETENWKAVSETSRQFHSRSATETQRIITESLDALFDMDIPLPPAIVSMHMEGIDNVVQRYVRQVQDALGPIAKLVPPCPPLTRYKQSLSIEVEEMEMELMDPASAAAATAATTGSVGKAAGAKLTKLAKKKPMFVESVPKVESSSDYGRLSGLTLDVVTVMLCSLQYLLEALPPITVSVLDKLKSQSTSAQGLTLLDGMLEGARQTLENAIHYGCCFLANKVVFWDLRFDYLELMYRHRVSYARADYLLEELNGQLTNICNRLPRTLHQDGAGALLKTSMQAFERVLLDGGPTRLYIPADVECIQQDLYRLKGLFYAEGAGLPRDVIDREAQRAAVVLKAMALESGPLVEAHKQARRQGLTAPLKNPISAPFDEQMLLKVLCHRADHIASKYLKKEFQISKRIRDKDEPIASVPSGSLTQQMRKFFKS